MAVSTDLLDFYWALFERSCDAVTAIASALNSFYARRGFHLRKKVVSEFLTLRSCHADCEKDEGIREPFRRGLGYAIQWYSNLRSLLEERLDSAVEACSSTIKIHRSHPSLPYPNVSHSQDSAQCARALQQLCPACFAGTSFGRPLQGGGDFHVCFDGNLHHRHAKSAGEGTIFHQPNHFLSKEFVDGVGMRIANARRTPAKSIRRKVPDEAVDDCERAYKAAKGDKETAMSERFDDNGLMALVCRHDIPLFLANIDTPGEQQKYAVALLEHLFSLIPPNATVLALYDIGCVLDRSIELVSNFFLMLYIR
jgi:hypothetical protein